MTRPSFFSELKRRNVIRMAGLYLVAAWLITQVAGTVLPMFDAPAWLPRSIVVLLAIAFLPALVFAWVYEITPEGVKRESDVEREDSVTPQTARRMDRAIIIVLALALAVFAIDRFVVEPRREAAHDAALRTELAGESGKAVAGQAGASIPQIDKDPSIAVLPMVNMSDDKANEYFSDGITEELLNLLARVPKLRVIARTSSFAFKGQNLEIPEIARRLHVAAVLEGSVRKSGDKVRITAQLIRALDGSHLWSETYDRTLDDIFKVQDEIASEVVSQLKIKLLRAAPTAKPVDGRAYALFLQAREVARQGTAEGFQQAIALYRQALAIDPNQSAAWTGLADVYCNQQYQYERPVDEATPLAREALEHALAVDPDYAPAHAQLGWIAIFQHDLGAAARHIEHALTLDPRSTDVIDIAAILARRLGRYEQAVEIGRYLLAHDPVSPTGWDDFGYALLYAGHRDEALAAFRKVLQLSPRFVGQHWNFAALLAQDGDARGAMTEAEQESDPQYRLYALCAAHFVVGDKAKSDALLSEAIERYGATSAYSIALLAALRGENDLSFEWLEKAAQHGEPDLGAIPAYPTFNKLHGDPRWLPYLRKIGYAPDQLDKIQFEVTLPQVAPRA
jgi:TolB-like protein/Flp pilus assembly protein TadD